MTETQSHRLPAGGRIDRERPLTFRFNGRQYQGYAGDTLASALLANGVQVLGRSFKFHRPRGLMAAGVEEPNALLELGDRENTCPNNRATLVPLTDDLQARSQNGWPGLGFDLGRLLDFSHRLWPAGFYNKVFKWPGWHWYEGLIRRGAGLGRLPSGPDVQAYQQQNAHCDVLVVGTGPAGLEAALRAANRGQQVILIEQDFEAGGSLLFETGQIDGVKADIYLADAIMQLQSFDNLRLMTSATVAGYYDHNVLTVHQHPHWENSETFWKIRAGEVVLATGAIEQPLLFDHNDRPGIMLAAAVRQYLNRYAVAPGRQAIIACNNDDAWLTAFALDDAGVEVVAIIDRRGAPGEPMQAAARQRQIKVLLDSAVCAARGKRGIESVHISSIDGKQQSMHCDLLAMSGGWNPTVHLFSQAGGKLRFDSQQGCFRPHSGPQGLRVVGAANGDFSLGDKFPQYRIEPIRLPRAGNSARQWVDFLHDVTVADIELAVRENYVSVEHLKRYTSIGMSVDQGKTSNLNALTLLAQLTGKTISEVGTTTFRPQFMPVTLGAIAGACGGKAYHPARLLPADRWHQEHGAKFDNYGGWRRPVCYPLAGESHEQAIAREVRAVRNGVGLFDASPLGKIEVFGPDAGEFLNRMYVSNMLTLKPGTVRYGILLNENGVIIDDGVVARLSQEHYLVNTTSGGAERIASWLEEWHQCEWPELELLLSPVTTQWTVATVAGPKSRILLQQLDSDLDLSATGLPHMAVRCGTLLGMPTRIQRVSYCGELSFEISLPANAAQSLWPVLLAAGKPLGICAYGIEALLVLRLEKGYLHVGVDTDGSTNPLDIGMRGIVARQPGQFVGKRSLARPNDQRPDRRQLVGLEALDPDACLVTGGHLIAAAGPGRSQGFVTSACHSPTLDRPIGLALLERGADRLGESVAVYDQGSTVPVRVVSPVFYDPDNERINA